MDTNFVRFPVPTGLSFEVEDLTGIITWADLNDVSVAVRLDHGMAGEEYEEVVAFHSTLGCPCELIMWRSADSVFIQPLVGVTVRYGSVGEALSSLRLKKPIVLTDIIAKSWPVDRDLADIGTKGSY